MTGPSRVTSRSAPNDARAADRRITVRLALAVFGILVTLTTAWALATPLTAVPDEPAHFVRAGAVARGELIGRQTSADLIVVRVPAFIAQTKELTCFAGDPTRTADCQDPVTTSPRLVETGTSAAFNSPLYYAAVGWPSLILSGAPALYAMRLVSAVLTSLLLTAMVLALFAQSRSWWPVAAALVGLTPMVLYLGGALNPNAIEMAAAGAVLAVVALLLRVPVTDAQRWRWGTVAVAASFALMSGRGIGALWLALIAVAAVLLVRWSTVIDALKHPATWFTLIGMAAATGVLGAWTLYLGAVTGGTGAEEPVAPRPPGILTVTGQMFENTFDYWVGWIGQFGWLDYLAPAGIQVVWHAALVAVLFSGLVLTSGRARWALVFLTGATLLIPPLIQAGYYNEIGLMWQGRYSLAPYLGCLILAGFALDDTFPASRGLPARRTVLAGAGILAVANCAAFVFVLRRYMIGSPYWIDMFRQPAWQPPGGWIMLLLATVAAWTCAVWLIARWTRATRDPRGPAPAPSVTTR